MSDETNQHPTGSPPPAFGVLVKAPGVTQEQLPPGVKERVRNILPTQEPQPRPRRSRAISPTQEESGVTAEWLPEPYRTLCPAGLRGEGLMRWYLAVQQGEQLVTHRSQTLAGISAQLSELGEGQQGVFHLLEMLGRGLAEAVDLLKQRSFAHVGGGQMLGPGPAPTTPHPPPARPAPRMPTGADSDDAPFVPAAAPVASPAAEEEEDGVEPGAQAFRGKPAAPPRMLNRDAKAVREFARRCVPLPGVPLMHDQQLEVADSVAEDWLRKWSEPGAARSSRWEGVIAAEIRDRLCGKQEELFRQ